MHVMHILYSMPLRGILPLEEKDWNTLINDLEQGQTKEQSDFLQEALKHANSLKISR